MIWIDILNDNGDVPPGMGMDYQQALQDIQAGRFKDAIAQLDELIQADAAQPKVWQAKAVALLSSGSVDAAIVAAEQVLRLNPDQSEAHQLLGACRTSGIRNTITMPVFSLSCLVPPNGAISSSIWTDIAQIKKAIL